MAENRELSPTTIKWDRARQTQENMVKMAKMGLHVFNPSWQNIKGQPAKKIGARYSPSFTETTLTIYGTSESMTFPVQTCTRVADVKQAIATTCMVGVEELDFVVKTGCSSRKQLDYEEIGRKVTVKGIKAFKPTAHKWPHPIAVVGAGYNGIKTCIYYSKFNGDCSNFVCFDRNDKVGGYCWITAANKTSKLQTEIGSFHVWWGPEFAKDAKQRCGGWPTQWEMWPKKPRILEHFHLAAKEYGMLDICKFKTNVAEIDIVGQKEALDRYYNLTVNKLDGGEPFQQTCSVMYCFPGSMTRNRIIEYPGEDIFDGHIGYGMNDDMHYEQFTKANVAIIGNGAFAVENVRTACELGAIKAYIVTRRKNLPSPRVPCWFVHQGPIPTPGKLVLNMFKPMFDLSGMGDPWEYWSVHAPADRSRATIIQNSRFGIGDVTFLALIYGKCEYVESTIKRLTKNTLHMHNGQRLDDIHVIVKSLGLLGDHEVDRLHKMKEVVGSFCGGDYRRVLQIDPTGMNAANFTTFSTGIGTYGNLNQMKYIHDYPKEFNRMVGMGLMTQLPRNKADEKLDKPAYVTDVKFAMVGGIVIGGMAGSALAEQDAASGPYKYEMYHRAHGTDRLLKDAIEDWDKYQKEWKAGGSDHAYVPYPYDKEMIKEYFGWYNEALGTNCSVDGPDEIRTNPSGIYPEKDPAAPVVDEGTDEATRQGYEQFINQNHMMYWKEQGPKKNAMFERIMSDFLLDDMEKQVQSMGGESTYGTRLAIA